MKRYFSIAAAAVALAALSALVYGYEYGINPNHIQILPFIEKIKDASLFPGDYFVDTIRRFPSVYPYVMAFLSKWLDLETLHLVLYFIFKSMLLIFAYGLAKVLFKSTRTAFIAIFLFALSPLINAYGLIGHDPLMKTSFYQTSVVAPLVILAMMMFFGKRYAVATVVLACIYYINALMGNFLLILFLAAGPRRKYLLLFAALMVPGALWLGRINFTEPLKACADFPLYLKLWYTGHYFPSFFTAHQWYHFLIICIFFFIFFQKGLDGGCADKKTLKIFLLTLAVMWAIAYVFAEILPIRSIIILQLLRSDTIFILLGIIFASDYVRSFFETRSLRGMAVGGLITLAMIEFSKPSYKEFILIILLLASYEVQIKSFLKKVAPDPERTFDFLWLLTCIFLITFSAISLFFGKASPKMGCMMIFSCMLVAQPAPRVPARLVNTAAAIILAVASLSYMHIFEYRIYARNLSNISDERNSEWIRLQLWARDNTPVNSMFIAPLEMNGFRVFSERPVFVDWVDGAAMHWSPGFEKAWVERLKYLGITSSVIREGAGSLCGLGASETKFAHKVIYGNLTEKDFRLIKDRYGAEYVIEDASKQLSFVPVYKNRAFCVYKID